MVKPVSGKFLATAANPGSNDYFDPDAGSVIQNAITNA